MKKLLTAIAVLMVMCMAVPAQAEPTEHNGGNAALAVFMIVAGVAASPFTIGGSFGLTAIAWPAFIGAVTTVSVPAQASDKPSRS